VDIRNPNQPLFIHRRKKRDTQGKEYVEEICFVPELVKMTGLTDHQRKDGFLMRNVA